MKKTLYYLFDPLCGWCYGAGPALAHVRDVAEVAVELLPTGLFSGAGARPMDDEFAAYAWGNDRRIEALTGQRFTERYRGQVLGDRQQLFDSGPATLALTAVALTRPQQEAAALAAIQQARYVDGRDITSAATLADVLRAQGLDAAADKLADPDPDAELKEAMRERTAQARTLMQAFGVNGVPAFIVQIDGQRRLLRAASIYEDPLALGRLLEAA